MATSKSNLEMSGLGSAITAAPAGLVFAVQHQRTQQMASGET